MENQAGVALERRDYDNLESGSVNGQQKTRRNACVEFWGTMFRLKTWANIFYLLTLEFAYGLFATVWTGVAFGMAIGFSFLYPIGTFLSVMFAISWRGIALYEVWLSRILNGRRDVSLPRVLVHVTPQTNGCCMVVVYWFKELFTDTHTWISAMYFILIKPFVSCVSWGLTLGFFIASFAMMGNIFVVAFCDVCYQNVDDWHANEFVKWIVTTYEGSAITIPFGFLLLTLTGRMANALVEAIAKLSQTCLSPDGARRPSYSSHPHPHVPAQSSRHQKCPHCQGDLNVPPQTMFVGESSQSESRSTYPQTATVNFDPDVAENKSVV